MSQSALSQGLLQMERLLGVPLFTRTKRSVAILPAAERFLPRAQSLMEDLDAAVTELRAESDPGQGHVEIACLSTVSVRILPPSVRAFRTRYPKAVVRVRDDDPDGIVDRVKSGTADFAISCLFDRDPTVAFRPLLEDELRFVCRHDHPLAQCRQVGWVDLAGQDLVAMASGTGIRTLLDRQLPRRDIFRHATYEVARVPSILDVVEQSNAVSVIPALALVGPGIAERFHHGPIVQPSIRRVIGLILSRDRAPSAAAQAFINILTTQVSAPDGLPSPGVHFCSSMKRLLRST